jgi:Bacterial protein of unknown function (DUF839)
VGRGRKVYFDVTTGGVAGQGQVWEYDPERELLTLLFECPGSTVLQSPDNVGIVAKTGHIFLQEDGSGEQFIRGLTRNGQIYDFAKTAANETEFAGGCFDPHGQILFVNQQETGAICPRVHRTRAPSRTRSGAPGRRWTDRPTGDSSSRELPTARRAGLPFRRAPSRPAGRVRSLGLPIAPWQPAVASPGLPSFSTTFTTVPHACGGVPDTRGMKPALLCELHAHTTWSDGCLALRELVDLYGRAGFDVLCITDHVLREDDPWWPPEACVHEANFGSYLAAVDSLLAGREAGAALFAAHPHGPDRDAAPARSTRRFWREWEALAPLVHRAELFNGRDVYSWIAGAGVPAVASGDVHAREHLSSWKTLLPCAKDEEELVAFLRSGIPGYLVPFRAAPSAEPAAAA